jgi:vacuolar-type H+-ATPase subunit F/Vma7
VIVPVFLGDEVTAAAYRLIGIRVHVVQDGNAGAVLDSVPEDTGLLLITATCATKIGSERIDAMMRRGRPLVAVVPGVAERAALPDLDKEVERALGIEP